MLVERRVSPRFSIEIPVKVSVESEPEQEYAATSVNLSEYNIELSCDDQLINALASQASYPHTCDIEFSLTDEDLDFNINGQVVTHRRLSQKQFRLVVLFNEMPKSSADSLSQYLKKYRLVNIS